MTRSPRRPRFFRPDRSGTPGSGRGAAAVRQPEQYTLDIERLSAEGRGIGFLPNASSTPVFVAGALPGERARVRLTRRTKQIAEAELLGVERAAAERQTPRCALFGRCGGCQLQMLDIETQRQHKQRVLRQLLDPLGVSDWLPPLTAAPWRYRHRGRFAVTAGSGGEPVIGFRAAGSHAVVPVTTCAVIDERLEPIIAQLPGWLAELGQWRRIAEVLLAVDATGRLALSWRAAPALPPRDSERLSRLAEGAGVSIDPVDLLYAVASSSDEAGTDIIDPVSYQFGLGDFTQVNPAINRQMVDQVRTWLEPAPGDLLVDYFCGLGNFTLALAAHGVSVIGIESVSAMVARATTNGRRLGLDARVRFETADLFTDVQLPAGATKALLDPPRAGARALCEQLATADLERIVYISCNPQTLVRDLRVLRDGGYAIRQAALADMFPQTGHSEALVLLARD